MPKSRSQKENTRQTPTTSFYRPKPGKKIVDFNINQENINGLSSQYFNASVTSWTSPSKLINSIKPKKILEVGPKQALNYIRDNLKSIAASKSIPNQLAKYAANCHRYSLNSRFSKEFENTYMAKRGSIQDSNLKKKSCALSSKVLDSASEITEKAMDLLNESTLRDLDNGKA